MLYENISWYQPKVERSYIYAQNFSNPDNLRYNHCVDVIFFKGRYLALWNANPTPREGFPGQFNYLSWSEDYQNWSSPVRLFVDPAYCENPVAADYQWQPSLVNVNDEYLLCAWCTVGGMTNRLYVARSDDGLRWRNLELPNAPEALLGKVNAFTTNHGFVSETGRIMFPCSLPNVRPEGNSYMCWDTKYSAILMSDDGGATWFWSEPIRCVDFEVYGETTDVPGETFASVWEPMVFDGEDGTLGLLVRNSQGQNRFELHENAYRMLFYSVSRDDGLTWTQSLPVELETICSRNFTLGLRETGGMIMIHNDQQVCVPKHIAHDRYHLAAFFAPRPDPDTLLPGPVFFPMGRAFYPNGFLKDGALHMAATASGGIACATLRPLPDYAKPFFMIREGRFAPEQVADGLWNLPSTEATIPLVLNADLAKAEALTLRFIYTASACGEERFPILTVGGVTRNGFALERVCSAEGERLVARRTDGAEYELARNVGGKPCRVCVTMRRDETLVSADGGAAVALGEPVIRKIAFGGLYTPQSWPDIMRLYTRVLIHTDSVTLEG